MRPNRLALDHFARRHDDPQAMERAYLSTRDSLGEIARHFGVHYSTLSRAVRGFENTTKPQ